MVRLKGEIIDLRNEKAELIMIVQEKEKKINDLYSLLYAGSGDPASSGKKKSLKK